MPYRTLAECPITNLMGVEEEKFGTFTSSSGSEYEEKRVGTGTFPLPSEPSVVLSSSHPGSISFDIVPELSTHVLQI